MRQYYKSDKKKREESKRKKKEEKLNKRFNKKEEVPSSPALEGPALPPSVELSSSSDQPSPSE